jgi:hypothetical protein
MGRDAVEDGVRYEEGKPKRVSASNDRSRSAKAAIHRDRNQDDGIVDHWEDLMSTCYAHLRSALFAIEELSKQPEGSPIDAYSYDQASGCVWVALVALAQCSRDSPAPR